MLLFKATYNLSIYRVLQQSELWNNQTHSHSIKWSDSFSDLVHFKDESIQSLWFWGELILYMELKSFLNTVEDTCTFFKPLK